MTFPRLTATTPAVERVLSDYDVYLHSACGLAVVTRRYRRRYASEFLHFVFDSERIQWKRILPFHVQSFIAQYGHDGRGGAAQVAAGSLRSFLRWLAFQGRTTPGLSGAVPHFPRWRLASLPTVMTDDQLRNFLASFDQSRPSGRRDYVMALCLVDLGLRVAEVAELTVDDVDQLAGTLRLSATKSRRDRVLPMTRRIRKAVIRDFFCERLLNQQNVSPHTVAAYRDAFRLLLAFLQRRRRRPPAKLSLEHIDAPTVLAFLEYLETQRGNCVRTRNARLAAIHSFVSYASARDPAALPLAQRILAIPQKRFNRRLLGHLTRPEAEAVIDAPDRTQWSGRRDRAMFLVIYNTGTRVSEAIGLRRGDLHLGSSARKQRIST